MSGPGPGPVQSPQPPAWPTSTSPRLSKCTAYLCPRYHMFPLGLFQNASAGVPGTLPPPLLAFHGATVQRARPVFAGGTLIAPLPDGLMPLLEKTKLPAV